MLKAVLERVAPALTHPLLYASLTIIHREARIDCEALDVRLAALDEKRGAHPDESAPIPRR